MARTKGASRKAPPPRRVPWGWIFGSVAALALLAGGSWAAQQLADPQLMPINTVRIDSPLEQVSREALREIVLAHADAGFLQLNVAAVREDLEGLAWVRRAAVRRSWPDVLLVSIQEQQAAARWAGGGLLNEQGERFVPAQSSDWDHLPLLRGPNGTEAMVMAQFDEMRAMLAPLELAISHLSMDERRAWTAQLGDGLQLGLGRGDLERRVLRFVRVYPGVLEPRLAAIERVDMRYTNGFAVRWRPGLEPPAAT